MKKLVVLTGAGISAESGIKTFRASDGLWESHRIEDVATPEAFQQNPALVLEFYNQRRKQIRAAQPNSAHRILADLQRYFDVQIMTQNIDDLHERAGSHNVLHLHGEIMKARSTVDETDIYPVHGDSMHLGETCERGFPLRPYIVWFGEAVPLIPVAQQIAQSADIFLIIGTSLIVYPAAGLVHHAPTNAPKFLVDPGEFDLATYSNLRHVRKPAVSGMQELLPVLIDLASSP